MPLSLFNILTILSLFSALMLSIFFLVTRKISREENILLSMLLLVFALQVFYSFATSTFDFRYFLTIHKPLFLIRQTSLLTGPMIYLYVRSRIRQERIFTVLNAAHLLPFVTMLDCLFFYYRTVDQFIIWESYLNLITTIVILIHNLVYIALSLAIMRTGPSLIKGICQGAFRTPANRWLRLLLTGFIMLWILNLNSFAIYMILQRPGWCAYTASIYALSAFVLISTLMLILLLKPGIFCMIEKYKGNRLADAERAAYLQQLSAHMEAHKPYLNPDINLERLAGETGIPPRILSQIINESLNKNFKSYILEYRIRESMKLLAEDRHHKRTILEILYQVGFNSKSTFNNQFKLFTSLTPLEYRARSTEMPHKQGTF
jgi:AraC-like DNA-binding protein